MKIVRFRDKKDAKYGVLEREFIHTIIGEPFKGITFSGDSFKTDEVKLLAPCEPTKIVATGLNYRSHALEFKLPIPKIPLIFLKPSTSVIGPEDNIIHPDVSSRVDYEAELAVVIGKAAHKVSVEQALGYVLGYTCLNDVTARDLQEPASQWTRAKSFDTFAPIGPWIETELDPANVELSAWVNGERKQQGNTNDLIYPAAELVSFISHIMTLLPGDVIATGTPGGIGPIRPGDTVEIRVAGIGILKNYVVKES